MHVEAKKTFLKNKSEILEAIRLPSNLENYHPFCAENKVEKWPGKGSIDYVKYLNGLKYRRDFIKWDESGYVLDIGVKSKLARVKWLVEGNSEQSSLKITIKPILPSLEFDPQLGDREKLGFPSSSIRSGVILKGSDSKETSIAPRADEPSTLI